MTRRLPAAVALASVSLALAGPPAAGQNVAGGALTQRYTFRDPEAAGLQRVELRTAPFAASIPLGSWAAIEVAGAFAQGTATGTEGGQVSISGLTDTEVGLTFMAGPDRVVVTAGATLPTGRSTQTLSEATVAGIVAAELLPFAITNWGSGGGVGGDVAVAFQSGSVGLGLSGGYRTSGSYEPLADQEFAYRPGNQLRLRAALDADVGMSGTLSILVGFQSFSDDRLGGKNLFRSGRRLEGTVSYAFAVGLGASALVYGSAYHREKGSVLVEDPELVGASDSPAQQLFVGGFNLRVPSRRVTLLPDGELRVFRSADGVGQGWVATAGATLDVRIAGRRFGRRVVLAPTARIRMGHVIVREGAESDLTGWEAGLTMRVEGGP